MTIYHAHHIIPKHMGGSDDPSNLIRLTVEEHAEAHKNLYEKYNKIEDLWAYHRLKKNLLKKNKNLRFRKNMMIIFHFLEKDRYLKPYMEISLEVLSI